MSVKEKPKSTLWRARRRKDLKQKSVAFIIGQENRQISAYERGTRVPSLEVALKLEIIYGAPIRVLFSDLYKGSLQAVAEHLNGNPVLQAALANVGHADYCSFSELLKSPKLSEKDFDKIRPHAKYMTEEFGKRLSETREGEGKKHDE